ncbi:uncharacterized protein GGS22DRAFT_196032 [Annulohypoxylon maeteangense]|uniref:uncharacterized protein n=1 Tax=Annulohypoxylon maeteangense TaxID=1927788 RepID=UPI0020079839|nr:uncharacterized protein GGS22DRAFT_196032 [Annulohypoxylon maeteangense]KAI0882336.1 hypothetical protein GGS22DRAFT_196032 [Annulohypoxylon maeteangense]
MYFDIVLAAFVSFLAVKVDAQNPQMPVWNVTLYSDKECKNDVSTLQIARNVTCSSLPMADAAFSFFPKGPKTFGDGSRADLTIYTKKGCPKAEASTQGHLANFGTCNTGSAELLSYDMYIYL